MEKLREFLTREYIALIAIGLICALLFAFLRLADIATGTDTHALDIALLELFREPGNPTQMIGSFWVTEAVRDVTALGSFTILTLVVLIATIYLLLIKKPVTALLLVVGVIGGALVSEWLKDIFARPRPEYSTIAAEMSASFPSGHSMLSAITYLTIAALLARVTESAALKGFFIGVAVILSVLVGITRVAMGVHFPSDVLAGWALGAAWAIGWAAIAWTISNRRRRT